MCLPQNLFKIILGVYELSKFHQSSDIVYNPKIKSIKNKENNGKRSVKISWCFSSFCRKSKYDAINTIQKRRKNKEEFHVNRKYQG